MVTLGSFLPRRIFRSRRSFFVVAKENEKRTRSEFVLRFAFKNRQRRKASEERRLRSAAELWLTRLMALLQAESCHPQREKQLQVEANGVKEGELVFANHFTSIAVRNHATLIM